MMFGAKRRAKIRTLTKEFSLAFPIFAKSPGGRRPPYLLSMLLVFERLVRL